MRRQAGMVSWDVELDAVVREDDGEGGVITTNLSADESGEDRRMARASA